MSRSDWVMSTLLPMGESTSRDLAATKHIGSVPLLPTSTGVRGFGGQASGGRASARMIRRPAVSLPSGWR